MDDKVVGGAVIERATPTLVPAPPPAPVAAAAPFKGVTEDGATVFENNKYFDVPKPNNNIIGTQNNGAIKTEIGKVDNAISAGVTPVPGHAAPTFLVGVDAGVKVCICIPLF